MATPCQQDMLVDSHVHLTIIARRYPQRLAWLEAHGCRLISWAFGLKINAATALSRYLQQRRVVFKKLKSKGVSCRHLTGIHPRCIPPDLKPEQVPALLAPHLEDPDCRGIGEIGLETADNREMEFLLAQIEWGLSLKREDLRFGIHTPRSEKSRVADILLRHLGAYKGLPGITVIDHCSQETIGRVLAGGYFAGITLSASKTNRVELLRMLAVHGACVDRIMCNTDSGTGFHEDLVAAAGSGCVAPFPARQVFGGTAARFFTLP